MSENLRRAQLLADHAWKMITSPGYNDTVEIRSSMSEGTRQQFEAVVELAGVYAHLAIAEDSVKTVQLTETVARQTAPATGPVWGQE